MAASVVVVAVPAVAIPVSALPLPEALCLRVSASASASVSAPVWPGLLLSVISAIFSVVVPVSSVASAARGLSVFREVGRGGASWWHDGRMRQY